MTAKTLKKPRRRVRPVPGFASLGRAATASSPPGATISAVTPPRWTFLTNHAHVLILLSQHASIVLREVALRIGVTERAVQRIIADLEEDGFIEREKIGRQNQYRIRSKQPLRHPIESHRTIGDLISLVRGGSP